MCPGGVPTRATARVRALWRPSPRRWWATAWQKASERGRTTARTGDRGDVVVLLPAAGPDGPPAMRVGRERNPLNIVNPGEVSGEIPLLDGEERSADNLMVDGAGCW